ncbi:MAG: NAD(P)-dependent oxidoreductase [Lachnospiraceae bacterium]|nr:NAD(P)-dependent oxidoreductase [Lachnospiraceae bacterium]
MNNKYFEEDIKEILNSSFIPWNELDGRCVLVTGATGLLGTLIVHTLVQANTVLGLNISVIAQVRNQEKARAKLPIEKITVIESDITRLYSVTGEIDYIIHAASITDSQSFIKHPVEVQESIISGTSNMLKLALVKKAKGLIFLSTMEVYGVPQTDIKIPEDQILETRSDIVRNSYSIGKIAAENLCIDYAEEYGVPTCILRLTQTFGPGVEENDKRVFAEMMRNACAGDDIILKTKGETRRNYLYTADAARAILMAMLNPDMCKGNIYNVANESTYCSIADMGQIAIDSLGNGSNRVRFEIDANASSLGYAPTLHINMDTTKIRQMGWEPRYGLSEMFVRMAGK